MSTNNNRADNDSILEITEEDYQAGVEKGWMAEDMLPVGKHKFRRSRHVSKDAKNKLRVTMYLDADVVEFFKQRASAPNAAPYQSQINQALRSIAENGQLESKNIKNELLEDEEFLLKLKERLAA